MFGLGGSEILVILIVALIFISPDKIPEIAQWLGKTVWKVKHTAEEFRREVAIPSLGLDKDCFKDEIREIKDLNTSIRRGIESPLKTLGSSLLEDDKESPTSVETTKTDKKTDAPESQIDPEETKS